MSDLTPGYSLDAGKIIGSVISAAELNHLYRVADSQIRAALRAHGVGVVSSPDESACEVLLSGGQLLVQPGLAVVNETVQGHGFTALEIKAEMPVTDLLALQEGDENYLFAVARYTYESQPHTAHLTDAREGAPPVFLIADGDSEISGAVLLAQLDVSGGQIVEVIDRRTFIPVFDLLQRVEQLEEDVESIEGRLDALESGDSGEGGPSYIAPAKWSAADPRETQTVIEEMIEAQLNSGGAAAPALPMQLPEDRLAEAILHTRDGVIRLSPSVADAIEAAELVVGFSGHAEDGSPPPATAINDTENVLLHSTLQIDTGNRELTP